MAKYKKEKTVEYFLNPDGSVATQATVTIGLGKDKKTLAITVDGKILPGAITTDKETFDAAKKTKSDVLEAEASSKKITRDSARASAVDALVAVGLPVDDAKTIVYGPLSSKVGAVIVDAKDKDKDKTP